MLLTEIIELWIAAYNKANVKQLVSLYANDAVYEQVGCEPVEGVQAIEAVFRKDFNHAKRHCLVEDVFGEKDWIVLEWKDPLGLQAVKFFNIKNDKIIFQKNFWHSISYLKKEGLQLPVDIDLGYTSDFWLTKFKIPKEDRRH